MCTNCGTVGHDILWACQAAGFLCRSFTWTSLFYSLCNPNHWGAFRYMEGDISRDRLYEIEWIFSSIWSGGEAVCNKLFHHLKTAPLHPHTFPQSNPFSLFLIAHIFCLVRFEIQWKAEHSTPWMYLGQCSIIQKH